MTDSATDTITILSHRYLRLKAIESAVEVMIANQGGGCTGDGFWNGWSRAKEAYSLGEKVDGK